MRKTKILILMLLCLSMLALNVTLFPMDSKERVISRDTSTEFQGSAVDYDDDFVPILTEDTVDLDIGPLYTTEVDYADLENSATDFKPSVGIAPLAITNGNYTTYNTMTLKWKVGHPTVNGTQCAIMQGMNTGTTNIYTAKIASGDKYCAITRTNANTGAQTVMSYYASVNATSATPCTTFGHANEIYVSRYNGADYMFVATMKTGQAIARAKISGNGLYFQAHYNLVNSSGQSISVSALRHIKTANGYFYFLLKSGDVFRYCKVPCDNPTGTTTTPIDVKVYDLFKIDKRNTVFATSSTAAGTLPRMEAWTNQGFGYSKTEKVVYVPVWDGVTDTNRNAIITYDVSKIITDERLEKEENDLPLIFATTTSFILKNTAGGGFEIESCNFRTEQGTTGDLKLYFNVNATDNYEGIYSIDYNQGSGNFITPVSEENNVIYTVEYNANGGTDSGTSNNKMTATVHVRGINTKLRKNYFTKANNDFAGWYLHRKSDNKWLYLTAENQTVWYLKGEQPRGAILALYEDMRTVGYLSNSKGDVVTCYAQWTPVATGTTTFYLRYEGNGGTGTMADTKVVYGVNTALAANAFVNEGYAFSGWIAHRRSDDKFIAFATPTTTSSTWYARNALTDTIVLKSYQNQCTAAKTSATDRDIVTMYAAWSRIVDPVYPASIRKGDSFALGGKLDSDTDVSHLIVSIKDSSGKVLQTHTVNPYAQTYDMANFNSKISFSNLEMGDYVLEIVGQTMNSTTKFEVFTLAKVSFKVITNQGLFLSDAAVADGGYTLDDYFIGFAVGQSVTAIQPLFKNAVTVTDAQGNALGADDTVGTGCIISSGGESCKAMLYGDVNGDGLVNSEDGLAVSAHLKKKLSLAGDYLTASDISFDGITSSLDYVRIKMMAKYN